MHAPLHRASSPGRPLLPLLLLASWLTACAGEEGSRAGTIIVSDSAGIEVVEHPGVLADEPVWEVDLEGALHLPGDFFQVRGASQLSDGTIVVADGGSRELRYFGADGRTGPVAGGEGEGPGEFMALTSAHRWPGDSIIVFDSNLRRHSLFGPRGDLVRTFAFEVNEEVPFANLRGVHADGSLVATGVVRLSGSGPEPGLQRYPTPVHSYRSDGSIRGPTGIEIWSDTWFEMSNGGFFVGPVPFGRTAGITVGPEHLIATSTETGELRVHSPEGELVRLVRGFSPRTPITPEHHRAEIERLLASMPPGIDEDAARRRVAGIQIPETLPAFGASVVDRLGFMWIEPYLPPGPQAPAAAPSWIILATDGRLAARASLPGGLSPLEIGLDYVLGVLRDEFGVEEVVRLPLSR